MKIVFFEHAVKDVPFCWLIEIGPRKLGVHKHDGWCMRLDTRTVFFDSEDKCVPLGPILDIKAEKLNEFLLEAERENPIYSESIRRFPKELLLKHIFHTYFSGYWPEKALEWLSSNCELQPLFKDELETFVKNKVMPQGARQKAEKMLRNLN